MSRELELKFELDQQHEFLERLNALGITLSEPCRQYDTIFLPHDHSFEDLDKGIPIVRIRQSDGKITTTLKKYISGITNREEVECSISDATIFTKYLCLLGFAPIVTVNKTRRKATYCGTTITLDYVEQLGVFTEIEIICDEENVARNLKRLDEIAHELGLEHSKKVSKPYDEMLYLRGKNNA